MVTPEDAATAAENALTALVDANSASTKIEDSYAVLGSLSAGLVSLRRVVDQLATWHDDAADRASGTSGDAPAGYRHAIMAAARLRQAATLLERTTAHVDAAWTDNGQIIWQPASQPRATQHLEPRGRPQRQLPPGSAFGGNEHTPGRQRRRDGPSQ